MAPVCPSRRPLPTRPSRGRVCLDDGMGRVTTRVRRTRFDVATGARVERPDTVAVEEPLEIRLGEEPLTTTMRTPGDDFDLAIGHLLTEGLLHGADEVARLMHCTDVDADGSPTYNVVEVTLAPGVVLHRPARERTEAMTSACGVCGSASSRRCARRAGMPSRATRSCLPRRRGRAPRGAARPPAGLRAHRRAARRRRWRRHPASSSSCARTSGGTTPSTRPSARRPASAPCRCPGSARRQRAGELRDRPEGERRGHPRGRGRRRPDLAGRRPGAGVRHHARRVHPVAAVLRLRPAGPRHLLSSPAASTTVPGRGEGSHRPA